MPLNKSNDVEEGIPRTDRKDQSERGPSRRGLLLSVGLMGFGGLSAGGALFAVPASAHVAGGSLSVDGDSIVTDDGQLQSLTVSLTSGHVSYDGLDAEAVSVDVALFAAPAGGATDAARNQIASQTATVALQAGLKTHAGHYDYSFSNVDVLAADDLSKTDFSAPGDGSTTTTDVDVRVELLVKDSGGSAITEADAVQTTTISVTNEERSSGAQGSGAVDAGGTNQSP